MAKAKVKEEAASKENALIDSLAAIADSNQTSPASRLPITDTASLEDLATATGAQVKLARAKLQTTADRGVES